MRRHRAIEDHPKRIALEALLDEFRVAGVLEVRHRTIWREMQGRAPGTLCPANVVTWARRLGWVRTRGGKSIAYRGVTDTGAVLPGFYDRPHADPSALRSVVLRALGRAVARWTQGG